MSGDEWGRRRPTPEDRPEDRGRADGWGTGDRPGPADTPGPATTPRQGDTAGPDDSWGSADAWGGGARKGASTGGTPAPSGGSAGDDDGTRLIRRNAPTPDDDDTALIRRNASNSGDDGTRLIRRNAPTPDDDETTLIRRNAPTPDDDETTLIRRNASTPGDVDPQETTRLPVNPPAAYGAGTPYPARAESSAPYATPATPAATAATATPASATATAGTAPRSRRKGRVIASVAGVVVLVAAAAGVGWFVWGPGTGPDASFSAAATTSASTSASASAASAASSSTSAPDTTTAAPPAPSEPAPPPAAPAQAQGECSVDAIQRDLGMRELDAISSCDGAWARAGQSRTDLVVLAHWVDGRWEKFTPDGTTFTGFACYSPERLDAEAVPETVRSSLTVCSDEGQAPPAKATPGSGGNRGGDGRFVGTVRTSRGAVSATGPACDGRNILIVNSVVEQPGVDTAGAISRALDATPGSEYTYPGQCPSLRGQLNGNNIYPVYLDFGGDRAAMCAAKAQQGGNARTLNTRGDFADPC